MSILSIKDRIKGVILNATLIIFFCGGLLGYTTGIISYATNRMETIFGESSLMTELLTASIVLGALGGSMIAGPTADLVGRKGTLLLVTIILGIPGNLLLVCSVSWVMAIIARFIVGLSIGVYTSVGPLYLTECTPPDLRGVLGVIFQFANTFFLFIAAFCSFFESTNDWRIMFGLAFILYIGLLFSILFAPETPRQLVRNNHIEEAKILFRDIYDTEFEIEAEINSIKNKMEEVPPKLSSILSKGVLSSLIFGFILCIASQWTGFYAVIYYITTILSLLGIQGRTNMGISAVVVMWWNCLSSIVSFKLISLYGRKCLILTSLGTMTLSSIGFAVTFYFPFSEWRAAIALLILLIYIFSYQIGIGPLFFVIINEIFPESMRGRIVSLMNSVWWIFNFILSINFLKLISLFKSTQDNPNGNVFYLFAAISIMCKIYVVIFVPETKGKSFIEIQDMFSQIKKKNFNKANEDAKRVIKINENVSTPSA